VIAELHNKISKTGSNLSDRREDQLTGDFFGSLRYLPFDVGIMPILQDSVFPEKLLDCLDQDAFQIEEWDNMIRFWNDCAYDGTEPDVVIDLGKLVIMIEAKLHSGLSPDNAQEYISEADTQLESENDESRNQLARESWLLINRYPNAQKRVLLLLAKEMPATEIYNDICGHIRSGKNIIAAGIDFGYVTWQKALSALRKMRKSSCADVFQNLVLQDLDSLLTHKGFEQFENFTHYEVPIVDTEVLWTFDYIDTPTFRFDFVKRIREDLFYEFK